MAGNGAGIKGVNSSAMTPSRTPNPLGVRKVTTPATQDILNTAIKANTISQETGEYRLADNRKKPNPMINQ